MAGACRIGRYFLLVSLFEFASADNSVLFLFLVLLTRVVVTGSQLFQGLKRREMKKRLCRVISAKSSSLFISCGKDSFCRVFGHRSAENNEAGRVCLSAAFHDQCSKI